MTKVREYKATVSYSSTKISSTQTYKFTEANAKEAGTVLEPDGIDIKSAQWLCERWTRRGNHKDIRYSYRLI